MSKLAAWLTDILVCPKCHATLVERSQSAGETLTCTNPACALSYPVKDGIPVLVIDEATAPQRS